MTSWDQVIKRLSGGGSRAMRRAEGGNPLRWRQMDKVGKGMKTSVPRLAIRNELEQSGIEGNEIV